MLVINKKCKICQLCKKDKKLLNRIYQSKYYLGKAGAEALPAISTDYKDSFSPAALRNHARKHQFIDSTAYNAAMLKKADEDGERKAIKRVIKAVDAVQSVIDKGAERLENGEITVSTAEMLRASQIKLTDEKNAKDQQLQYIEMIAHFASGSDKGERVYVDAASGTPESN